MTFERLENLNGRVAVVTGAAGGVGWATVCRLSASGAKIIAIVRRNLDDMQARLNQLGSGHVALMADVRNGLGLKEVAAQLEQCDILVNAAGESRIIRHTDLDSLTDEIFDSIIQSNLRSVYSCIRAFAPLLKKSPDGLIVNIGSAAAVNTGGSNVAYAAAKAGLESMTRNLALALAPVRVVNISPSALNTGFLDLPNDFYNKVAMSTPLKRIGTVEDIASAVEACATTMRFTTGTTFVVDGGRTL